MQEDIDFIIETAQETLKYSPQRGRACGDDENYEKQKRPDASQQNRDLFSRVLHELRFRSVRLARVRFSIFSVCIHLVPRVINQVPRVVPRRCDFFEKPLEVVYEFSRFNNLAVPDRNRNPEAGAVPLLRKHVFLARRDDYLDVELPTPGVLNQSSFQG